MCRISLTAALFAAVLLTGCGPGLPPAAPKASSVVPSEADNGNKARQAEFQAYLKQGKAALAEKRCDEAVNALAKASELMPDDQETRELLARAVEVKRQSAYDNAMTSGREALSAKNHERAFAAFSEALQNKPGDPEATARRTEAEFPLRLEQGSAAMTAKRFQDAIEAYTSASRLKPDEPAVRDLLAKAQQARAVQIKEEYTQAVVAGEQALAAKNYPSALDSFNRALRLIPGDEVATTRKKEAEFHVQRERGEKALQENRLRDAVTALENANRLRSDDKQTANLLQEAREKRTLEIKAEYAKALDAGKKALSDRRFDDAVRSLKEAAGLMPDQSEAGRLLREAEGKKSQFESKLSSAKSALASRRYNDAISQAREAEALAPFGNSEPGNVIREAENKKRDFQSRLSSAKSALAAGRYYDALRDASEADRLSPFGNSEAGFVRGQAAAKTRELDLKKQAEEAKKRAEEARKREEEAKKRAEEIRKREEEAKKKLKKR